MENGEVFYSRPSFSFPFVKPPNMIPNVDESLLFTEFGDTKNEFIIPSPQALWIKLLEAKTSSSTGNLRNSLQIKKKP